MKVIPIKPMRPINGGPFEDWPMDREGYRATAKINGWRLFIHLPTGTVFNRHLSESTVDIRAYLPELQEKMKGECEWLDCEYVGKRAAYHNEAVIVLDAFIRLSTYDERRSLLESKFEVQPIEPAEVKGVSLVLQADDHEALYRKLLSYRGEQKGENCFYEGIVSKRGDSEYKPQRGTEESPSWIKHRFV